MANRYDTIKQINTTIDDAVNNFTSSIPKIEKELSRDITNIIKDLETTNDGKIRPNVKNLRKMNDIQRRMESAFESDEYLKNVDEFTSSYDAVRSLETQYFDITLAKFTEPSIMNEITNQSIKSVTNALTGSNIVANVIDPVNVLVRQGIETGLQWDDLRESIKTFLTGADGGTGALSRYTTTIVNDSLNTYARTYENMIADREGIEWFEYVGRELVDTREFCRVLDNARWFKRSDIPSLIAGKIKNYTTGKTTSVPLYRKTSKPYGMKAETTSGNFIQLCGGWNCGHHAYPVPDHLLPDSLKNANAENVVATPTANNYDDAQKQFLDWAKTNSPEKNIDLHNSIKIYSNEHYFPMNNYFRGKTNELNEKLLNESKQIDELLNIAPKFDGIVYRGTNFSNQIAYDNFANKFNKKGDLFADKAYLSTSVDKNVIKDFSNNRWSVQFEIKSKTGVLISEWSEIQWEKEVLFKRETKFIVDDIIEYENNVKLIKMTEI